MSYGHRKRSDAEFAWVDTRETVNTALRSILRRAANQVLDDYFQKHFLPAIERGEIPELDASPVQLRRLLRDELVAQQTKELEAGDGAADPSAE